MAAEIMPRRWRSPRCRFSPRSRTGSAPSSRFPGSGPESLRAAAGEPHFLAGVLEHVVSDEKLLLDFAAHQGIDPFDVTRARQALAGPPRDIP